MTMRAFHNDPTIKAQYLARVAAHRSADEIVHGKYWERGKGCAVGCTIHGSEHGRYEAELGIPAQIAHLEDVIFEGLNNGAALEWPERFLEAIPVGVDLSLVWPRFALWLLADQERGVIRFAGDRQDVADSINGVAALYSRWVETGTKPSSDEFAAARAAAWAAAEAVAAAACNQIDFAEIAETACS